MKYRRLAAFIALSTVILTVSISTSGRVWGSIPLGLDLRGGISVTYKIEPPHARPLTESGIQSSLQAVLTRVNALGVSSPTINLENCNEIEVELPGIANLQHAEQVIGTTAQLAIYGRVAPGPHGQVIPVRSTLLVTGADIDNNASVQDNNLGQPVVDVTFKDASAWAETTRAYLGLSVYTFLNGRLIDQGRVDSIIANGQTAIGPLSSLQASQTLAEELNAGALPYPLSLVSSVIIGPQLGAASLRDTLIAGLMAVLLIFSFMVSVYRIAGLIAILSLVAYVYVTLLIFSALPVTLTLAGLAALVLGLGMAVDANIISYERIKDEIRQGRSLPSAVIAGSRRALHTILDANVTTFIAAAVMDQVGQSDIRGFAVALMVSLVVSLLCAVLLSRALLSLFTRAQLVRSPAWYGAKKEAAHS
ncbi:MAG: protein translocase subunit SecD [Firmicutes bacterium]|nr:protein translocase subunit SecD [Bacillota bacterium]